MNLAEKNVKDRQSNKILNKITNIPEEEILISSNNITRSEHLHINFVCHPKL